MIPARSCSKAPRQQIMVTRHGQRGPSRGRALRKRFYLLALHAAPTTIRRHAEKRRRLGEIARHAISASVRGADACAWCREPQTPATDEQMLLV